MNAENQTGIKKMSEFVGNVKVEIVSSMGTLAAFYPEDAARRMGAYDYEVEILFQDGRSLVGGVTLFEDKINKRQSSCGKPLDGWLSSSLLQGVRQIGLTPESQKELFSAIERECAETGFCDLTTL
jgi:hypothetical protein